MGEKRTKLSLTGNTGGRRIQSGGKLQAQSASQPSYPMLGRSRSGLPEKKKPRAGPQQIIKTRIFISICFVFIKPSDHSALWNLTVKEDLQITIPQGFFNTTFLSLFCTLKKCEIFGFFFSVNLTNLPFFWGKFLILDFTHFCNCSILVYGTFSWFNVKAYYLN